MKVLNLNLANYDDHPHWGIRKKIVVDWIRKNSPDIILFQEVRMDPEQSSTVSTHLNMAEQIASEVYPSLNYQVINSPAQYYDPHTKAPVDRVTSLWEGLSTLVLSSYPIQGFGMIYLPFEPESDLNQRICTRVRVQDKNFLNIHLSTNSELARNQLSYILEWISSPEPNSLSSMFFSSFQNTQKEIDILAGDFNCPPSNVEDILHEAGYEDVWMHFSLKKGYTFPSKDPVKRIDDVFVTQKFMSSIESLSRVFQKPSEGVYASDHLGLVMTFK